MNNAYVVNISFLRYMSNLWHDKKIYIYIYTYAHRHIYTWRRGALHGLVVNKLNYNTDVSKFKQVMQLHFLLD